MNSLSNIQEQYQRLNLEEIRITEKLDLLMGQQCDIEAKLRNVSLLVPRLKSVKSDAKHLSGMIHFTCTLAENVSAKVRELDIAKGRVSECQKRVNDLLDLQLCREGVISAMKNEDFEKAAAHVHRFLSIDETTLKLTAGDIAQGPTVDSSLVLLHEAQAQLCKVLQQKFDEAVRDTDAASVERFFKIFPLLNMHEEGISKFGSYLAAQLKEKTQKSLRQADGESTSVRANVYFADTLTVLLESVARIIEIHQPLVETYYGPGRLLQVVEYLQPECDKQANQILVEFRRSRQLDKQIHLVSEVLSNANKALHEKCDPRILDAVLAELTLLSSRTVLYLRFLRRRVANDLEVGITEEQTRDLRMNEFEKLLQNKTGINRAVQELLGHYIMLERYFLVESVSKAVAMDTAVEGSLTSSIVDDVFFLVKKSIRRSLTSCSIDSICAVINNACTLLEEDYALVFQQQCKLGFPSGYLDLTQAYNAIQSSLQQGSIRLQPSDTEKTKANFLTALNNIETSIECIETLDKNVSHEIQINLGSTMMSRDQEKIKSCLAGFQTSKSKFRHLLDFGHEQLKSSAIKPRIKPWVDQLLSVNHVIDEEEFSCYEAQDPFIQELNLHLDGFMSGFKDSLTVNNYQTLIGTLTSQVAQQFEKVIFKTAFNRLGALQLDKEIRALITYLSTTTTWTIRDRFTRLTQIVTILNIETLAEISEYWGPNAGTVTWRLTPQEVREILMLRTDFRADEIKRLKL
ncbi:conserved oligomeric Golgi complex subunit 4 isoform X1 [Daphnia magna]|uniref:conserved oligomeric Golgi complex subunit 4 isoform X1 n=1 Tax=Daphnia magna TaxID=35525 RepID=UPI001E1BDE0C|nr:conserved oligomeric Golgi complex subunit 4 isoform X1 [Daphnia magna]